MSDTTGFLSAVNKGYTFKSESVKIGIGMLDGKAVPGADINLPLKTMNRHGLIAGATGTGKTKTLQMISEALSNASVPVFLVDIKGDLSGIGAPGTSNPKIVDRCNVIGIKYEPETFPVEFYTLSNEKGTRLRATVTEFGPILLSRILELNDTQEGLVAMIFKYCDDNKLPLLDLKDFIKVLQYISNEGKAEMTASYGNIASTSTGTILRKVIGLQQQGADQFFGEKSFEVADLMRIDENGRGMVNVLRVTDLQDKPTLFSTFMLQLLAELYGSCPEEGDIDKPKLVLFIDEAHLVFQDASDVLLKQIETMVKLIRSKGIGIFFCTQNPMDVPSGVLAQLGLKVQHALRAFTAADRTSITQTAKNYPTSTFYKTEDLITQLGIGEALVTMLDENGVPTPLVHCMMAPPKSRMDILTPAEIDAITAKSKLVAKYNQVVDSDSAYEMLTQKIADAAAKSPGGATTTKGAGAAAKPEPSTLDKILNSGAAKQVERTAASMITRTLLGALGMGGRSSSAKKSGWF